MSSMNTQVQIKSREAAPSAGSPGDRSNQCKRFQFHAKSSLKTLTPLFAAGILLASSAAFADEWTSYTGEPCGDEDPALFLANQSPSGVRETDGDLSEANYGSSAFGATAQIPEQAQQVASGPAGIVASNPEPAAERSPAPAPIKAAPVPAEEEPAAPQAMATPAPAPAPVVTPVAAALEPEVCHEIKAGQAISSAFGDWDSGEWQLLWEYPDDIFAEVNTCVKGTYEMAVKRVVKALRDGGGVPIKVTTHVNPNFSTKVMRVTGV